MRTTSKALLGKGKRSSKGSSNYDSTAAPDFYCYSRSMIEKCLYARATMQRPQEVLKACENIQWTEMSIKFFAFYLLSVIRTFMGSVRKCVYLASRAP